MAREMKDSGIEWIGEIPVHWNLVPFYRLVDQVSDSIVDGPFGSDMKNEEYVDAGVPVIQLGAIKENGMDFSKMHFISDSKADILRRHNAFPFNLAIAKMMPAGRCCEIPDKFERYVVSADVIRASVSNAVLRHFLNYAFNTYIKVWANAETSGSTRARINIEKLKKFKFALPDQNEMEFILNKLDRECAKIDKAVEATKASIEEYKKLRQAIITEAVTKGLDPNVEMKDSGVEWIGEIPFHWNARPIKNSFTIVSGSTPNSDKSEYWDGDIPWITPADFKTLDKITSGGSRFITKEGYNSCSTNMIPKGSIIFSKRAPIGSVVINSVDLCTNQGCLSCIKNEKTDSTYFYYVMSIFVDVFNLYGSGTTFKEISATAFGDVILPLPPILEQKHIASLLDTKCSEIDSLIKSKEKLIEELTAYRKSLIFEYVTGKKEVPAV